MYTLPEKLHLLEFTTGLFAKNQLQNTYLIACQHLLPSLQYFLREVNKLGMPIENMSVIGKCYSSSRLAYKMLQADNIYVSNDSFAYDSHIAFDEQFKAYIENFIKHRLAMIDSIQDKNIIILDDGGELINAANKILSKHENIFGVEQTSSGYNKLQHEKLFFPVINVARSYGKLNFESPHIAISVLNQLKKNVNINKKNILILGKGVIGSVLQRYISDHSNIDFYDQLNHKSILSEIDLAKYDIIIGATGDKVIDDEVYPYLKKNVFLMSVSSSDREFSAVNLRNKTNKNFDCHKTLHVNNINLVNSGFPINFYGSDYDNVPLENIQLTCALLLAGICQTRPAVDGFVDLNMDVQLAILEEHFRVDTIREHHKLVVP